MPAADGGCFTLAVEGGAAPVVFLGIRVASGVSLSVRALAKAALWGFGCGREDAAM